MVGDYGEPSARFEGFAGLGKELFQCLDFVVDLDAQGLEHLCQLFFLLFWVDKRFDNLQQPGNGCDWRVLAGFGNCRGEFACLPQFAVEVEDVGKFRFRGFGYELGGIPVSLPVHTHIQCALPAE